MASSRRTDRGSRPQRRNRQAEVNDAAVEIFWRKGYPSASIQDVAEHVGVLKGSLYHYIDSKEDLLWEIMEVAHVRSSALIEEVGALDVAPFVRLHRYVEGNALWYLENPKQVTVALRDWRYLAGERLATADQRRRRYESALREMIVGARASRSRAEVRFARYAARYVQAALNAMPDWYHPDGQDPPGPVARAYADMSVGILLAPRDEA